MYRISSGTTHGMKDTTVAVLGRRRAAGESIKVITKEYASRTGLEPVVISGSSPGAGVFGHLELARENRQETKHDDPCDGRSGLHWQRDG